MSKYPRHPGQLPGEISGRKKKKKKKRKLKRKKYCLRYHGIIQQVQYNAKAEYIKFSFI